MTAPVQPAVPAQAVRDHSDLPQGERPSYGEPAYAARAAEVVSELNEVAKVLHTNLQFSIDEKTKKIVVKVLDADTQKVIRQIPPEEVMKMSARIQELLGVLFDQTA
ncbi:MAG: flagellar protein FlaG [Ignavibacteria bacterium]|nr:flagellar protein FlaG [Ignavibacteria bacterium]